MPAGTVLCLLPATDIRERERLATIVGIFYADFAVTDEHPGLTGCPPAFLHHIQRMASRSCQDFRLFEELAGCIFQPAILCSKHQEALSVADFIMQVMPDTRFPVTDSDYPFLYLPQPFGHTLRSLLPAVTFFFFTGTFFSLVLNTVGVRDLTPALLFDKTDWQGAVGGVHQDRVSQQHARLRVSGGIPLVIKCPYCG